MSDSSGYGGLMIAMILFGIVWAFLWLLVPFLIYAMHENIKRIRVAVERAAKIQGADRR